MVLAVAIIKGGTGKSTTAAALLQAAVADGKRALAIDLDPQGNLSFFLAAEQNVKGAVNLLHGADFADVVQLSTQGMQIVSASADLAAEKTRPGSARRLKAAIDPIRDDYDLIIVDTPPTMGDLTYNALQAADALLIPLEADTASLQGLYQIADIANQIAMSNPELVIIGSVITRYDGRSKLNRYMRDAIAAKGGELDIPLLGTIKQAVAIKEAQSFQQSIYSYAPRCKAALDYMDLYRVIMESGRDG